MKKIRLAIAGVGNCASSLLQGIEYYRQSGEEVKKKHVGLMHYDLGGYRPEDIEVVAAFDVDQRKVGQPLEKAIYAKPNSAMNFVSEIPPTGVTVQMGKVLDGVSEHMAEFPDDRSFRVADQQPVDVAQVLKDSGAEVLVCYLPVGSEEAVRFYAESCLAANTAMVNCMPVFIASHPEWSQRFKDAGIPIVGDDIKAQLGATITHRVLTKLFTDRGVKLERTYQLNTGGNTDFLNMLNQDRLKSKKISKTEAVQSQLNEPLDPDNIHIGPSDYVPFQNDNKVCFLRMEGSGFGGAPVQLEMRLSVEDSPNSAGVAIDAIRCAKLGLDRKLSGPLCSIASCTMKHPPVQYSDSEAFLKLNSFIEGRLENYTTRLGQARASKSTEAKDDADKIQHSRLLSKEVKAWWVHDIMGPVENGLIRAKLKPNQISWIGFALNAVAATALGLGNLVVGGWLLLLSGCFDFLDGRVARRIGLQSSSGAFLDSVLDRYMDAFILLGLGYYFFESWVLVLVVFAFLGTSITPYIRAKSEGLGLTCRGGAMQRPERVLYLGAGCVLSGYYEVLQYPFRPEGWSSAPYLLILALAVVALMSNKAAIERAYKSFQALQGISDGRKAQQTDEGLLK